VPLTTTPDADYTEFRQRILIEKNKLDSAAEEQARIFLEVCERHVHAVSVRDAAKDELGRSDAINARTERARLIAAGEKSTEAIINDFVLLHPEHERMVATISAATAAADRWYALRTAFDHRMRMIRELVSLYASGYWTNSGAVGQNGIAREALAERARDNMATARAAR